MHQGPRRPKTVLLVDDSAYWADTIGEGLRQDGYVVSILYDALAAVERLRVDPPHILITDYFLATLDGGKLCQVAKRMEVAPPIVTIILTGGADRNLSRVPSTYADVVIAKNATQIVMKDLRRAMGELAESVPPPCAAGGVIGHERLQPRVVSAKLHGMKEYLDALHEGIGDAVIGVDASLRIYSLNSMALELFGVTEEGALAKSVDSVLGVGPDHPIVEHVRRELSDGSRARHPLTVDVRKSTLRVTVARLKNPSGADSALLIARDLSDLRSAEEERAALSARLHESDKLAALGQLLAGISHEINNPLAAVLPNLTVLSDWVDRLSDNEEAQASSFGVLDAVELLRETIEATERIRTIVGEMRVFSHPKDGSGQPTSIASLVDDSLTLAASEIRFKARIRTRHESAPELIVDRSAIRQVFLNILLNASQAIGGHDPEAHWVSVESRPDGQRGVVVEIANSGPRIPEEVLGKVFEPFFTTKQEGEGTGLGLAIAYETVRRHGGYIEASSGPDRPTTFRIWLPLDTGLALKPPEPEPPTDRAERARVLIVDDDSLVRNSLRRVLDRIHQVATAATGAEALELLERDPFDVVLCDLIMPAMSGMELYGEVHDRRPEQARRFVFLTGGTSSPEARDFLQSVDNLRAYKPVDVSKIDSLIADCVERFGPVRR